MTRLFGKIFGKKKVHETLAAQLFKCQNTGRQAFILGDYEEAELCLNQATLLLSRVDSSTRFLCQVDIKRCLAEVYFQTGRYSEAATLLNEVLGISIGGLKPKPAIDPLIFSTIAICKYHICDYPEARDFIRETLREWRWRIHDVRTRSLHGDRHSQSWVEIIAKLPSDINNAGVIHWKAGDKELGENLIRKAIELKSLLTSDDNTVFDFEATIEEERNPESADDISPNIYLPLHLIPDCEMRQSHRKIDSRNRRHVISLSDLPTEGEFEIDVFQDNLRLAVPV